jgi:hypothetical protein
MVVEVECSREEKFVKFLNLLKNIQYKMGERKPSFE